MDLDVLEQAYRNAVFDMPKTEREKLFQFLKVFKAHYEFSLNENKNLTKFGCFDYDLEDFPSS